MEQFDRASFKGSINVGDIGEIIAVIILLVLLDEACRDLLIQSSSKRAEPPQRPRKDTGVPVDR